MRFVLALTTYNRLNMLKATLQGWEQTKDPAHSWTLIVADDGSTDGTIEWLLSHYSSFHLLRHHRQGVHHQLNRIFCVCHTLEFDVGFRVDDDLLFLQSGWDHLYATAIQHTGYDHLVHHDVNWVRKQRHRSSTLHPSGILENCAYDNDTQGAFWTFTPRVLQKVGFIDVANFGPNGFGHRDYTFRCCKAGFNKTNMVFDIVDSNRYIRLNLSATPTPRNYNFWNTSEIRAHKESLYSDERVYVPYNFLDVNQDNKILWKPNL